MRVLLLHLDGKLPNIALMRVAAHHGEQGDDVELRYATKLAAVERGFWDRFDRVYASLIFERSRPIAERLLQVVPAAVVGGTGWNLSARLEDHGIVTKRQDYSVYPKWRHSIGFTQRGCRLKCSFCVVPRKEGSVVEEQSIEELYRGEPWPRQLIVLDNDFFGQPRWRERIDEMIAGKFKVCFSQGINARMLTDETAAAIARVQYYDDSFRFRSIYTAWDNRRDEGRLFAGLEALVRHGVKPKEILVYILIGYWPGETHDDRDYRRRRLREFGCKPYPMPFVRTPELIGFQRWVCGYYDRKISWSDWVRANYQPRNLRSEPEPLFAGASA